jgi:hemerythrin
MHTAIEEHHGSDVVSEILSELADYTKIHFAAGAKTELKSKSWIQRLWGS